MDKNNIGNAKENVPDPSKPIFDEDYDRIYSRSDYTEKTVLEIGADYGSTAHFFLSKGAAKVISVEGNHKLYSQLVRNVERIFTTRVVPIEKFVTESVEIEKLIQEWKPDIMHLDCQNCEALLLQVKEEILGLVDFYQIEVHHDLQRKINLVAKFSELNYDVNELEYSKGRLWILYCKKRH